MSRQPSAGDFELTVKDRGPVRLWTWERPARRNAMPQSAWDLLGAETEALAREAAEPGAGPRCLVLYGRGGVFAAGADLTEMGQFDEAGARSFLRSVERVLTGLERLPIPAVAAIEGAALGGGLELALACDLRLAAEDAVLGIPASRLGAVLTRALVGRAARAVGRSRAADLLLTGRRVPAREALQIGLVQRLAPSEGVLDAALSWADEIADNAPLSVRMVKGDLRRLGEPAGDGGSTGAAATDAASSVAVSGPARPDDETRFAEGLLSEDFHEGVSAFLERRPPRFLGR